MRGRSRPSSSVSQKQTRMAMMEQDADEAPFGNQQVENMQEEEEDAGIKDELSSSLLPPVSPPDKCRRERANKSKPGEMTEEEMMDLALRLSEQEASLAALRQQKEEEAMRRAIQESQVASHTQLCPPSQSLLDDAETPLRICSWREFVHSKRKPISAIDQRSAEDGGTPQTDLNRGFKRCKNSDARAFQALERRMNKRLRRKEGSPLLEMPDLSPTQKIDSQASPCSSDVPDLPLDSPQSSDSTQMEDCQLHRSPVFPLTGCRAEVRIPPLDRDVLQACRTSGFVCCSQDGLISPQKLSLDQPKSPTFPQSPELSSNAGLSKSTTPPRSPVFSEADPRHDGETQPSPEYVRSPVFGRNAQRETSPSAFKRQVGVCNSGFVSFSQESLASSVRSMTCQPESPVFPGSPSPPPERPATCKSPVFSQTGQSRGHCKSPVSGRTGQEICPHVQKRRSSPSPAGLRDARGDRSSAVSEGRIQSPRRDGESEQNHHARCNASPPSDAAEEKTSKDQEPERMEPTSNMALLWSDEDEDVTPVGSPSPVFPVEGPAHQAAGQPASLDRVTAASAGTSRPSSSPAFSGRQQCSATGREPISGQGTDGRASASPGSTVHYYWGVPFCPRGLDPDDYTQVILAQMEVFEKSLKRAQRGLLRKAEWGEAVLPQPEKSPSPESPAASPQQLFPQRRGLRLRGKNQDTRPAEAEDNKGEEEEEERGGGEEEEGKRDEGEGQAVIDDCDICPETQLSDDDNRTQDLMMDREPKASSEARPHEGSELPGVEMLLQGDPAAEEEPMEPEPELEEHQQTEGNDPVRSSDVGRQRVRKEGVVEDWGDPDVVESKDRGPQRSTSPELGLVVPQNPETSMDCPICQRSFPVTEIEMHAAFCDGEADASQGTPSPKPRRKRTRRSEVAVEDTGDAPNAVRNQEKCYICQRLIPLREYSRHTELCIHRQRSGPAKENLLSALEKTESRDSGAGPSGSRVQPGDVIDLRDDDDDDGDEGGVSAIRISNSPIKSFIPISEATGCLIDFKKQHRTKKLSQRRRWRPPED